MNLLTLSSFVKKFAWIPFYLTMVVIFLVIIFVRQNGKKENSLPPIETLKPAAQPVSTARYRLNFSPPNNTPSTLALWETIADEGFVEKSSEIIKRFNLSGEKRERDHSEYGKGFTVSDASGVLSVYKNFVFFDSNTASGKKITDFTEAQIAEAARNYLKNLNLTSNSLTVYKINFYHFDKREGENFYLDSNATNASLARVEFPQFINNYKILNTTTPTSVTFSKDGKLVSVHVSAEKRLNKISDYPILSFEKAFDILAAGAGSVISVKGEGSLLTDEESNYRNLKSADIVNAYPAYYPSQNGKTLLPVWVFEGESEINGKKLYLEYIVDAIEQKNLIQN